MHELIEGEVKKKVIMLNHFITNTKHVCIITWK